MPKQGTKQQVAVRIPLRQKAELEHEADERGVSRSEYIRSVLDDRHRADRLAADLERKEQRVATLEEQLNRRSQVEEKVDVLATRVEDQQEQQARQRAREDALASAPPWRRFKWWATGTDPADAGDDRDDGEESGA